MVLMGMIASRNCKKMELNEIVLNTGGFKLKGVISSNHNPPENLTDGNSIRNTGMGWFSK